MDKDKSYKLRMLSPPIDGRALVAKEDENGEVAICELRKHEEGKPIVPDAEMVEVERTDEPGVYRAKVLYDGKKGPARVATKPYRDGWDSIFGRKPKPKGLN